MLVAFFTLIVLAAPQQTLAGSGQSTSVVPTFQHTTSMQTTLGSDDWIVGFGRLIIEVQNDYNANRDFVFASHGPQTVDMVVVDGSISGPFENRTSALKAFCAYMSEVPKRIGRQPNSIGIFPDECGSTTQIMPRVDRVTSVYNQVSIEGENLWLENDRPEQIVATFIHDDGKVFRFPGGPQTPNGGYLIASYWTRGIGIRIGLLPYDFKGKVYIETTRGRSNTIGFSINDAACPSNVASVSSLIGARGFEWVSTGIGQWSLTRKSSSPEKIFVPYLGKLTISDPPQVLPQPGTWTEAVQATYECASFAPYGSPTPTQNLTATKPSRLYLPATMKS